MSWSLSVNKSERSEFAAAVDAAVPSPAVPPEDVTKEQNEQVAAAKAAMKALAESGAYATDTELLATAYGHANPEHKNRDGWSSDVISVNVSQAQTIA